MPIDYQIILIQLPGKVNETVTKNEDDSYTIFIEETLSPKHRKDAMLHALRHILGNDFDKKSVQEIEAVCHYMR